MEYLVISASLNPRSRSKVLAKSAYDKIKNNNANVGFIDLSEIELPFCDADTCYDHPNVKRVSQQIREAKGILLASPIYNYDVNSAAKNLIELTGRAWTEKVVGFLCAAGGKTSYMSVMPFANSLMLDFRCVIIPRFLYTTGAAFADGEIVDDEIDKRIEELASNLVRFTEALLV